MHRPGHCPRSPVTRPHFEVADIFREHGEAYRARHALSPEQGRAMRAIENCRTAVLGGHRDVCLDCGLETPAYNSCRNRHCPKCQALDQERWLEKRRERILPVHYFHVVFTVPGELASLALRNRARFFKLLFYAAAQTLLRLGRDPRRLGALLGLTIVLHTWTRDLRFHPHVHCIVTGGGLSPDGCRWVSSRRNYLFPVKVLSRLFRGIVLDALRRAHRGGHLDLPEELTRDGAFVALLERLSSKSWITYCKRPFAGPEQVFSYLGRYTHRVALSNRRILSVTAEQVTLRTRGDDTVTLTHEEFIRRFLLHVLPRGFVKIRHYGLLAANNVNTRLATARRLLAPADDHPPVPDETVDRHDWQSLLERLTGFDPRLCPACGSARRQRLPLSPTCRPPARSPPPAHLA